MRKVVAVVVLLLATMAGTPDARAAGDPAMSQQWALERVGATRAWGSGTGRGVTVAVVDSGVDLDHVDLKANLARGADCVGAALRGGCSAGGGQDDDGHGTHVAGIVAADAGNGEGIAGVAPDARIMPVRALRHVCLPLPTGGERCSAEGSVSDAQAALRWAVDHGANVVNMSVADDVVVRQTAGSPLAAEIRRAWERGVIVVAAAGNDLDVLMGARYDGLPLLVAGATTRDDAKASYSNSVGDSVWGMVAPGGSGSRQCPADDVVSTYLRDGANDAYACLSGTSMAAPHVAGAAAVLLSMGVSPAETVDRILGTTDDIGAPGRDATYGHGRLNLARAVSSPGARPADSGSAAAQGAPPPAAPPPAPGAGAAPTGVEGGGPPATAGSEEQATPPGAGPARRTPVRDRVEETFRNLAGDGGRNLWWALLAAALIATWVVLSVRTRQRWREITPGT